MGKFSQKVTIRKPPRDFHIYTEAFMFWSKVWQGARRRSVPPNLYYPCGHRIINPLFFSQFAPNISVKAFLRLLRVMEVLS
jgi:hypothetical protein